MTEVNANDPLSEIKWLSLISSRLLTRDINLQGHTIPLPILSPVATYLSLPSPVQLVTKIQQ